MAKSKIFITGIAGFLGSHLADALLKQGHEVSGCDNLLGGYRDNVSKDIEFHEIDAQDLEALKKLTEGIDIVYHCAAAPHEGLSVFSPHLVNKHTYTTSVVTFTAAAINKVRRIVFCSSMARYGNQGSQGGIFTEDMKPEPVDPYGIAKYASERLLKIMAHVHGMEYSIAIPHNIYGPRQKYDDPYRNVISIFANRMLQGKQPIIYGDGEQKRSFSYIDDAVDPLVKMGFQENTNGELFNIGPDEEFTTVNHAAEIIADILHFKLEPIYVPERPQEVKYAGCNAEKARRMLRYSTSTLFENGVRETVEWIKQRGAKPFEYHLEVEIGNEKTPETWTKKMI
ncbi:MAG: epimerase [Candidatus Yanofskybacteria bacterium RIFCSPHIGHO2_02_FULL_44_12b]|nr:MAG: epimerase [Candidatus Yanofskybacteria bacterium RIFCSPHIGHO2_02_FULL_44_12b]